MVTLTENAASRLNDGVKLDFPLMQILDVKSMSKGSGRERYRVLLSDGDMTIPAVLATQLNSRVADETIAARAVIQLETYQLNTVQERRVVILVDLSVVETPEYVIGKPKISGTTNGTNSQQPSTQNQFSAGKMDSNPPSNRVPLNDNIVNKPNNGSKTAMNGGKDRYGYDQKSNGVGQGGRQYEANHSFAERPGPIAKNDGHARIIPISQLNPYMNRWTIKGRVTAKSAIRTWNKGGNTGRVRSVDFLDDQGGEIRAVMFNEAIDLHDVKLEEGKVYSLTRGTIKSARRQYNNLNSDYEITLERSSLIEEIRDDGAIPQMHFNFSTIEQIESKSKDEMVDTIGIVQRIEDTSMVTRRDGGQEIPKRMLLIRDQSNKCIEVTLWNDTVETVGNQVANLIAQGNNPVLALKAVKVSDFGGVSLGTLASSQVVINPDITEAHMLRGWYDSQGKDLEAVKVMGNGPSHVERRLTIRECRDQDLGKGDRPDYVSIKGTVVFINQDRIMYPAHPETKRKLSRNGGDEQWFCERDQSYVDNCVWRYLMTLTLEDHTGKQYVNVFDEGGKALLGKTAQEMHEFMENGEASYEATLQAALFKQGIFTVKIAQEEYNQEQRLKFTLQRMQEIDFASECKNLLQEVRKAS